MIQVSHVDHATNAPDDLLTAEEIQRILAACRSLRDREFGDGDKP